MYTLTHFMLFTLFKLHLSIDVFPLKNFSKFVRDINIIEKLLRINVIKNIQQKKIR